MTLSATLDLPCRNSQPYFTLCVEVGCCSAYEHGGLRLRHRGGSKPDLNSASNVSKLDEIVSSTVFANQLTQSCHGTDRDEPNAGRRFRSSIPSGWTSTMAAMCDQRDLADRT